MNNLIELGRETFEFAHSSSHEKYGSTAAGAGAGALAGAGAAVGGSSLIAKRRRAEKDRIKKTLTGDKGITRTNYAKKKPQGLKNKVDKRTKAYKDSIKKGPAPVNRPTGKKPPTANSKARAEMRRKYGKNWYRPGGSKKKLLGYGALAGAALGGAAGYYARKKKGDS